MDSISRPRISLPWIITMLSGALMFLSAFPGWMSPDSRNMYGQAIGELTVETHHTVWLTALWSHLAPVQLGPILPYVLQQLVFWLSIGIISSLVFRISPLIGACLPFVVFLLDHTWVLGWIWKDAAALSAGILSLSFLIYFFHKANWRSLLLGLFFLGVTVSIRWYLLAAAFILLVTLIVYAIKHLGAIRLNRHRSSIGSKFLTWVVSLGVFMSGYLGPLILPVITFDEVRDSNSMSQTFLWDLVRVQCETAPRQSIVPEGLTSGLDAGLCERYNPLNMLSVLRPRDKAKLRLPSSPDETVTVQAVWIKEAPKAIPVLLENRVLLSLYLLRSADPWVVPNYNLDYGSGMSKPSFELQPHRGQTIGFDAVGLEFLKVSRLQTALTSIGGQSLNLFQSGYFWVLTVPVFLIVFTRKKRLVPLGIILAMYSFPWLWVLGLGFVSPWSDTRYVAISVLWSIVWSAFVIATSSKSLKPENGGG